MKKTLSLVFAFALVLAVLLGLASCGKDVEFNVNFVVDGEVYATVGTSGNESIKIPENPTKDGYTFDGWYVDDKTWEKLFKKDEISLSAISNKIKLYSKFSKGHVHEYIKTITPATCTVNGYTTYECACGHSYVGDEVVAN